MRLEYGGKWKLKHVEAGMLFRIPGGSMAVMTEYGWGNGTRGDAYLLGTGEAVGGHITGETLVTVWNVIEEDEDTEYYDEPTPAPADSGVSEEANDDR